MRILFCNYEYPPIGGGGGVVNALLAEELAQRHEVTVLTSQGLNLPQESLQGGVRVVRTPVFFRKQVAVANLFSLLAFLPMGIRSGKKLFKTRKYDILNTHFVLPSGPVGHALARVANVPNVLSVHGGDLYDPSKWLSPHRHPYLQAWVRRMLRRANAVVGASRNTLDNMRQYYTPELQGVRIPLGIRRPPNAKASRSDYHCQDRDVLLVTVGRLVARKGLSQLIQIIAAMKNPQVRLLIVGTGPAERRLRDEVSRHQLADQVIFLGYVQESEKFRLLHMADVYVSTSQHEGFGLVFLEAMACGLPIVCYDRGGQTDFLVDGETGYCVPFDDMPTFESRCEALVKDADLRQHMGAHNRCHVKPYYIDQCARQYESLFQNIVTGERPGQ